MSDDDTKTIVISADNANAPISAEHCPVCGRTAAPQRRNGKLFCGCCGAMIRMIEMKPGEILLDHYRILKLLGIGGYGSVYLVHPLDDFSKRYVVKVLKNSATAVTIRRFKREAEFLSTVHYEGIVQLIEFAENQEGHFIVLEYVEGNSLSVLRKSYDFDETSILIIAKEVAKSLNYMWTQHHLIHRDIKPQNIMLNTQNHVKLLDFGISKDLDDEGTALTMTQSGLGSPGYMSPEQFFDAIHAGIQSDMFSLGATICFMLTGEPPFHGENVRDTYENTIRNTPPDIRSKCPGISREMEHLVQMLMQVKAEDRPGSWQEVISAIRSVLQ